MSLYTSLKATRSDRQKIYTHQLEIQQVRTLEDWDALQTRLPGVATAFAEVTSVYHVVGFYSEAGLLHSRRLFLEEAGDTFLNMMDILRPIVALERTRAGQPRFRTHLDGLEQEARTILGRPAPDSSSQVHPALPSSPSVEAHGIPRGVLASHSPLTERAEGDSRPVVSPQD
jgi:hypothetical protein